MHKHVLLNPSPSVVPSMKLTGVAFLENDNLREEYSKLYEDVDEDIPWARIALGRRVEAVNLWIGNSRTTTCLHRDNYENVFCQVIGKKVSSS